MIKKIKSPNLEHLRSFYQVCSTGSITAAVTKTGKSRATLSRHIASIEANLSSILFIRGAVGFILTDLGKTVFEYADNIFKAETNLTKSQLIKSAEKKLKESSADMIIANDIGSIRYKKNPKNNQVIIVDSKKNVVSGWMDKEKIAKIIRKQIEIKIK